MTDAADPTSTLTADQRALLLRRLARAPGASSTAAGRIVRRPRAGTDAQPSLAQEQFWYLDRCDPGNPAFNIIFPLRLRGRLQVEPLGLAVEEVVRRHESLRTTFPAVAGRPVQRISPGGEVRLEVDDLTSLPPGAREHELLARVQAESEHRFRLETGPLLRVRVLRLDAEDHALSIVWHHIVGDGWSLGVFLREVAALYGTFSRGLPSPLPEPELQFSDWAAWQREEFGGGRGGELLAYWRRVLDGAPPVLRMPADHPRPFTEIYRGADAGITLHRHAIETLEALGREEGATRFMLLLAVFQAALALWTGERDLVVATPVANRTRVEAEPLIGYMINTLVLRTRLPADPSFGEVLRRVRETVAGAFAHQELPFETLVEELRPELRRGHHPVFQAMFILQNATEPLRLPGIAIEPLPAHAVAAEIDLTANAEDDGRGGVRLGLQYAADLFEPATIDRLARLITAIARAAVADPDAALAAVETGCGAEPGNVAPGLDGAP
jgi:hypothetical protein